MTEHEQTRLAVEALRKIAAPNYAARDQEARDMAAIAREALTALEKRQMTEREQRVALLRTAIDGYLGADRALDALLAELEQAEARIARFPALLAHVSDGRWTDEEEAAEHLAAWESE